MHVTKTRCWALVAPLCAAVALLSGCARGLPAVTERSYVHKPASQTLVIASIDVKANPKGFWAPNLGRTSATIVFAREPQPRFGDERLFQHFYSDHVFVLLEPGSYAIRQVRAYVRGVFVDGWVAAKTYVPFDVPEDGIVYLGAVELSFDVSSRFPGYTISNIEIRTRDRYQDAVAEFRQAYPNVRRNVENRAVLRDAIALSRHGAGATRPGEPADPPSPEDAAAAGSPLALPGESPGRLEPGTAIAVLLEHGDAHGMKRYLESWLEKGGFKVAPAASPGATIHLRFGYFMGRTGLTEVHATAFDTSGTRLLAACSEREQREDTALGYEILARCVRALGGNPPEPPPPEPTY